MVQSLVSGASGGFAIAAKRWSFPVYDASQTTPHVTVSLTASWAPAHSMSGVPIPSGAAPDPAGDGHLVVMNSSSGCEYDFWQAQKHSDGSWSASWGNATLATDTGIYAGGLAARAAGFANGLGLIRPEELAAGTIPHALSFAYPYTKSGGPVAPATASDGSSNAAGATPEGARIQLDPNLNLDSLGLNAWQKTIARALQTYGMFLADGGGTASLYAQNPQSTTVGYPWGDADYPQLPTSLLSHMRVLTLPAQAPWHGFLVPTPCAVLS